MGCLPLVGLASQKKPSQASIKYKLFALPLARDAQFVSDKMLLGFHPAIDSELASGTRNGCESRATGPDKWRTTDMHIHQLNRLLAADRQLVILALAGLQLAIAGIRVVHVAQPGWSVFWG